MARILLAEDDEAVRGLIVRALAGDGHDIVAAQNGVDALDALSHGDARFDLLLTDVQMPEMDGIALAMTVARDHPAITIMLMTGYADQRERAHGLDALVHDVLSKPFTVGQLQNAVTDALVAARH